MMIWKKITVFTVVVLMSFFVAGGESIFAQKSADQSSKSASVKLIKDKPSVKKSDKGYEVSFSVKKATDVTVRIVNEKGEVVRHLASGFVGGDKAAKPFHPKSLSQTIVWDGNDDKGKNVTEKCKVSVGAGMNAKFDKYLLYNPDAFIAIGAIAVNSKGELYISGSSGVHDSSLRVFDKDGKYLRRDWPYSPALKGTVEFYNSKFVRGIPVPAGVPDYEGNTVPISINHSAAYYFYTQATGMGISPYGVALGNWCWGGPQFWVMKDGFPFQGVAITFPWAVGLKVRESKHIRVAIGPDRDFYIIDRDLNVLSHIHGETLEPVKSFSGDFMIKMQAPVSVAVQPNGNIWVTDKTGLTIYDKNGNLKEKGKVKLIDEFNIMLRGDKYLFWYHNGHGASNGVAVARDGSIYTVDAHAHNGSPLVRKYWENKNLSEPSRWRYSTEDKLVKFPPKGGQESPGKSDTEWEHAGISGTGGWSCGYYECHTAQISVDEDDRVWCHDAAVYNVKALDAAGNLMLRVGVYGNEDCKGGGGNKKLAGTNIVIDPEIPLTRPTGMAVWKDLLFITDEYANRTVRCKLEYTDKEEVEVK